MHYRVRTDWSAACYLDEYRRPWWTDGYIGCEVTIACKQRAHVMVALLRTNVVFHLLPSAAGVYIFWKNMYRLMCLVANIINRSAHVASLEASWGMIHSYAWSIRIRWKYGACRTCSCMLERPEWCNSPQGLLHGSVGLAVSYHSSYVLLWT